MDFPAHIEALLDQFGVAPATKAALYDLYASLGSAVLEKFAELAETVPSVREIVPDQVRALKAEVVAAYVQKNHPQWMAGMATPSLWHPRTMEGRAAGLMLPMGDVAAGEGEELGPAVFRLLERTLPPDQSTPEGVLVFGKNGHYGGRLETISFDIVPYELETALACALAAGQQHTAPGSVGETSGTVDTLHRAVLIWETQPNVLKPAGERNREVAKLWRRHRNWHVATLAAAILWSLRQELRVFVLRGDALAPAHEVNAEKPVAPEVVRFHDRTVQAVVDSLGAELADLTPEDTAVLMRAELMNHGLRTWVAEHGAGAAMFRIRLTS